jgi:flagellar motor switch protein FliG
MLELVCGFAAGITLHRYLTTRRKRKNASPKVSAIRAKTMPRISLDDPVARAAVIFMSLPPEASANIFSHLSPKMVQDVTLAITLLPNVTPETKSEILDEFTKSLGIAGDKLELAASQEPALIAKAIVGKYGL